MQIIPKYKHKVKKVNGCWEWNGYRGRYGYGFLEVKGEQWSAHRYFYINLVGEIPKGLVLDHLCRNTRCVNPKHLEPVTHRENVLRQWAATRKPHCPLGHEYTPENSYVVISKKTGWSSRTCKECKRRVNREWRARVKAKKLLTISQR